jgi:hypothetical protein
MNYFRIFLLLSLSLAPLACGPSAASYCAKLCDCAGCNEQQRAECEDSIEDLEKQASEADCSSEFDAVLSCNDAELECVDGNPDNDGCEAEEEALSECGAATPVGGSSCDPPTDRILAKYEECGLLPGGEEEPRPECTPELEEQLLCTDACVADASCEVLGGEDPEGAQAFADCVSVCV